MNKRELHWNLGGQDVAVRIDGKPEHGIFLIGDREIPFSLREQNRTGGCIEVEGRNYRYCFSKHRNEYTLWLNGQTYRLERLERGHPGPSPAPAAGGELTAPMPGTVLRIEVAPGDAVEAKQALVLMESMKMENTLYAPKAGRIAQIHCAPGKIVEMGEVLLLIE